MKTAKRIYQLMQGSRLTYVAAIAATCLAAILSMANPVIFKITVDNVIEGKPLEAHGVMEWLVNMLGGLPYLSAHIWICGLAVILVTAITGVFSFLKGKLTATSAEGMAKRLKDSLYDHLQKMPYEYHVKAQTGDLIQRCTSDVETVRRFLGNQMVEILRTLTVVSFALYVMLSVSVKMTLVAMASIPVIFVFAFVFFSKIRKAFKECDEKEGQLSTVLQENLSGVRVVRAFGRQRYEMDKYMEKNGEFRKLVQRVIHLLACYWSLSDLVCMTQIGVVMICGIFMTQSNEITLGSFLLFNSYVMMLLWPIRELGRILSEMGKMQVSLSRIYDILDNPAEQEGEKQKTPSLKGDIVFDNVSFGYEPDKPVLQDMSFHIRSGETIAVLGATGSGKSTLMHILLRLYDYGGGSVTIGSTALRDISKKHLRRRIGIVLQEPFLYSKTIRDNIGMASQEATDERIYEVTRVAAVHDAIEGFEKGYDTLVGEKGVTLSGGQKQRVAIARTLIKNSDILIFDDSLSAVDTETDSQIREALKEKQKDVTTIIISQRITTLMHADRIFVMEDGRLTAQGTHNELARQEGLYSRIWAIQSMLETDFEEEEAVR